MGAFDSKPLNTTPLNNTLRRNPLLFGVPFVMIIVVASYALVPFAQTKYELQDRRISKVRLEPSVPPPILRRIFRSRKSRSSAWRIGRESSTSVRNTLQVSPSDPFAPIPPIYLPSASRNSVRRLPKIGNQNALNVQPEHLNGVYHRLNLHRSGHDPL